MQAPAFCVHHTSVEKAFSRKSVAKLQSFCERTDSKSAKRASSLPLLISESPWYTEFPHTLKPKHEMLKDTKKNKNTDK